MILASHIAHSVGSFYITSLFRNLREAFQCQHHHPMEYGDHVLPHDPLLFAKQYRDMRRTIDDEIKDPRILRIHFEDLIYRYDFTTKQINEFLGISEEKHKDLRKHFNHPA